jgi:hypothetical protein
MQRNVIRFAVMVAIVLAALASGIGLGFGLYKLIKPIHRASQQSVPGSTSTIHRAFGLNGSSPIIARSTS